jgi:hypothetical protein
MSKTKDFLVIPEIEKKRNLTSTLLLIFMKSCITLKKINKSVLKNLEYKKYFLKNYVENERKLSDISPRI